MKVLITGGYGFIGSHIADRFKKEGYEVFIIDNLSTGKKENVSIKHKSYVMSVEDTKCEEIFQANMFDVVVHLAAQISVAASIANPRLDTESNVLGLANLLHLAKKHRVKKFIYASSAAVYGEKKELPIKEEATCSPISPYGISKWVGESYCAKWQELYGLETVSFRFSNVYGPRQDARGEGGVVSVFMSRLLDGENLIIHGDGNQTRDFIYVEDVADAIYRASNSDLIGVYNLSTNTECSVNQLAETLSALRGSLSIVHTERRHGDIDRSVLCNERVKRDLDWSPLYSIEEGIQRTYAYFESEQSRKEAAAAPVLKAQSPVRKKLKKFMPYIENGLAFALTAWLTLSQQYSDFGVIDVKLFYIVIIGIMYGNRQSMLAVLLSIGLFGYQKISAGSELVSLMYIPDFFFQIAIYVFIGLVVGYSIERKNAQLAVQEQRNEELENKYDFLSTIYQEVRDVKDELQLRILNAGDSYGKIYSVTKELESLEPEDVFNATVNVVGTIMNASEVSIYTVNRAQSYLRLVARSTSSKEAADKSLKVADYEYLQEMLTEGKVFINKQLSEQAPLMCAPIFYKNNVVAVVAIDGISFEKFTLYHQNLFKTTVDLVASSLTKAIAYFEATENQRYVEGTSIMRPEFFRSVLDAKRTAWENHQTPYLLLKGIVQNISLPEVSNTMTGMLRETDYTGLNERRELLVLLSNTTQEDAVHVLRRFSLKGITLEVVQEGA
ncbi:NAD-dependent epimerase/dehydratase family protein [Paenibacillus sp. PL2-23]|uniref:NAD-dependent epimerase/dehydratase family protein n=1 Tax=Paenibacillus sp. PL2-23 TaxID=2100729 RepID=UPI0030FBE0B2